MSNHRIVRATIVIDAENPANDDKIDRVLKQLGLILLANGHPNVIGAELLTEKEEPRAPVDPSMN